MVIDVGSEPSAFEQNLRGQYADMEHVCHSDETEIPFSVSFGFASSDELGWDFEALVEAADKRMYADKNTH